MTHAVRAAVAARAGDPPAASAQAADGGLRRAPRPRVRRPGALPDRQRPVPLDALRADAALRLRALERLPDGIAVVMKEPTASRASTSSSCCSAAARGPGRGAGRDRRDPAEVGVDPARARGGDRGLPHPARAGGRAGRGGAVDRPHHRRHLADHQAGRLDHLQRHPAPRLRHPHRDPRQRGHHQVPHRRRPLPGDGADRQAPPPDASSAASR